jgi:catechol 2,3-dioxygenase-like lactoylglutathione lyase family enzyme
MIPISGVSHVSVTVTDLEAARGFYGGVLGLREIARPAFGFPGVWYALDRDLSLHITVKPEMPLKPADRFDTRDPHLALAAPTPTTRSRGCRRAAAPSTISPTRRPGCASSSCATPTAT